MKTKEFFRRLDEGCVVKAIRQAEALTSGEVRVLVTRRRLRGADVAVKAREEFARLGMTNAAEGHAVLFYVAPSDQAYAVTGGAAVHAKVGQSFWEEIAGLLRADFARGEFTSGLVGGIGRVARELARLYPRTATDHNELPDVIARD
jgi:uncharacterized membrane protein